MPTYAYTCDDGDTKPIRLRATTATAGGFTVAATNDTDSAKVSKGNREFGLRPRGVRLSRNIGSAEEPNMRYRFLPVVSITELGESRFDRNATVTIDGVAWTVVGRVGENTK